MSTLAVVTTDEAFTQRLRDAEPWARRVATFVLGTTEGADDVVQIALERAWRARDRYDGERPFDPWFLRIVANAARNDRRGRGRRGALQLRVASRAAEVAATTPEDDALAHDDRRAVLTALNRLDADDRSVLALRYVEGLDEATTAEVLGLPVGTVKSRASRAKQRLRAHLEELP